MVASLKLSLSVGFPLMRFNPFIPLGGVCLAWFLVCEISNAQSSAGETPQVSLKIDLVAWGADIPGLTVKAAAKNTAVTALSFRYSKPVKYAGPNILEISQVSGEVTKVDYKPDPVTGELPLDLFIKNDDSGKTPAGTVPPEILARRKENPNLVSLAVIPLNSRSVTILLAPGPGGTYTSWVIDDDPAKLPFGQLRIHNLSPFQIAFHCTGNVAKELKAKESFSVSPDKNHEVGYELAYKVQDAWKKQETNLVTVREDEQAQMIVLKSKERFFVSGDGSQSGFLQMVVLRRSKKQLEDMQTGARQP